MESAVFNWSQKRGVDLEKLGIHIHAREDEEGRIVCKCFGLSEPYLRRKIEELNLRTIAEITNATKAGGACMACHHAPGGLQDLLDEIWGKGTPQLRVVPKIEKVEKKPAPAARPSPAISPYQYAKMIEKVFDEVIRPMLTRDGGDVEIIDIKENLVFCRLQGACAGCGHASQTLKLMVEKTLKDLVDERIRVIEV